MGDNINQEYINKPVINKLESEMELLHTSEQLDLNEFINFLFEKFPIKHKRVAKKPVMIKGFEKSICIELLALYHPDKINEKTLGKEYTSIS